MKICPCCGKPPKNCKKYKAEWYKKNKIRILDKANRQYSERRQQIIEQLGGVCSHPHCNCTVDLQFDHINPLEKSYNISERLSSWDIRKLQPEIKKCQLLCPEHHAQKTKEDAKKNGYQNGKSRMDVTDEEVSHKFTNALEDALY